MKGTFISFEGPDGAGKTSVITAIYHDMTNRFGYQKVLLTREPGGNRISEQIRDVLFDDQNTNMDSRTEALLFAAARRQHIVEDIEPALKAGKIVLSDRYIDSSVAYQGGGRHLGTDDIWELNQFAIHGLLPQLTIYLDIDSELGLQRINQHRSDEVNRLDREKLRFHRDVRASYLVLAQRHSERIVVIDASQPLADVISDTQRAIQQHFKNLYN
ncbi:MAG: dTMP kinase [Lactobacillus sp.]|jgi:dTMP kinase|uniref:dTMP kinase n=1 Tax=Limosilactobacillus coleohominis TaxID=181675 RepID=UPI0015B8A027|nr:dTMP kinase [Limosilactobacillus coleohominis]MCI5812048.1 dTMP kinase [Lactobacillus sp.]MDY5628798.1 dTMP kinase [Limosilactobacillus coleohominis]